MKFGISILSESVSMCRFPASTTSELFWLIWAVRTWHGPIRVEEYMLDRSVPPINGFLISSLSVLGGYEGVRGDGESAAEEVSKCVRGDLVEALLEGCTEWRGGRWVERRGAKGKSLYLTVSGRFWQVRSTSHVDRRPPGHPRTLT